MKTYEQALKFIHNRNIHGKTAGLHRINALLEKLGNPHVGLPFLHIAGTNGKGSTATMLASVLVKAGYKVGCFTSPFIFDFRERFAINGKMIEKEDLIRLSEQVERACLDLEEEPTEFEIVTAIGMLWFKEEQCDYIALEVGMGGRFDATNVIQAPLASVICAISLDHTEILGDTVEKIAYEKAGIIKEGCPVILYPANPEAVQKVIRTQAKEKNAPFFMGEATTGACDKNGCKFRYKGQDYALSLTGAHQINNAVTVIETLDILKERGVLTFTEEQRKEGLLSAYIPARLERICQEPFIFVDGGHNKDGIDRLVEAIDQIKELSSPLIIFGMMKDKPYQYAIQKLALRASSFLCVSPDHPRALSTFDIKNMADLYCEDVLECDSFEKAALLAKEKMPSCILVAGSLYITGPMIEELKKLF